MAFIEFNNVSVDIPVYNANSRSLKNRLIQASTGGILRSHDSGFVVVKALDNLTFSLKEGDRVALLGHNGAGKTTLLRVLGGVYHPTSGSATVYGNVGSLIDVSLGIDPEATGRENIYIRGALLGMQRSELEEKVNDIIEFSGLGNFVDMPLRTYSAGMQLRLAFAVSTITRPEILLMDEWLSVGDESFKHKAEARLNDVVQASSILVIATHSRELVLKTCNRAIYLEHGRIKMDGNVEEVCAFYF